MAQPIQLDRNQPIGSMLSDLAVILGPDPDLSARDYTLAILPTLAKMVQAVEDEARMYVRSAVEKGATWQQIGDALGVSRQAAHKRYGRHQSISRS